MTANQLGIRFVDFADLIVECANSLGMKSDSHDDIINFAPSFLAESVSLARSNLLKMSGEELLILETHLAPRIKKLWYTFTSPDILKERNTIGIVVIADDLNDIKNKKQNRSAKRDLINQSYEILNEDQQMNIIAATTCCVSLGIPLQIIWNKFNHLEESINQLTEFILELKKKINLE